ncbi:MAG: hypothetical protein HY608_07655 [Planctomycetes bacterium]|nr:hypothetical protein [Planctomycetota bacterium]
MVRTRGWVLALLALGVCGLAAVGLQAPAEEGPGCGGCGTGAAGTGAAGTGGASCPGCAAGTCRTLEAEVVDLACLFTHPETARGAGRTPCAQDGASRGLPLGLLSDGTLYLALGAGHSDPNWLLSTNVGSTVSVHGCVREMNGMKGFLVASVGETAVGGEAQRAPRAPVAGFTCPMHPDVTSPRAGSCPKCGMDLVPADPAQQAPLPPAGGG